jgi:hypothetical protein
MIIKIHVYLPEEAVDCWFPARAEHLGGDLYRLIDPSPEDPVLEFHQWDVVRCRTKTFYGDAGEPNFDGLVAYERIGNRADL